MKKILILFFTCVLVQKVFSYDSNAKYLEVSPDEIMIEIGVDCGKDHNSLDFIVKIKNKSKDVIFLSDSFLGLSEGMSDSFGIIEDPSSKKTHIPYLGIIEERRKNSRFPYGFIEGHDLYIRYPIYKFYKIDLKNDYEIIYNVEFFSSFKKLIFVGYAKAMIGFSDCEKEDGYLIKYKKIKPTGIFVEPIDLGIIDSNLSKK